MNDLKECGLFVGAWAEMVSGMHEVGSLKELREEQYFYSKYITPKDVLNILDDNNIVYCLDKYNIEVSCGVCRKVYKD